VEGGGRRARGRDRGVGEGPGAVGFACRLPSRCGRVDRARQVGKGRGDVGSDQNRVGRAGGGDAGGKGVSLSTHGNGLARRWEGRRHGESPGGRRQFGRRVQVHIQLDVGSRVGGIVLAAGNDDGGQG